MFSRIRDAALLHFQVGGRHFRQSLVFLLPCLGHVKGVLQPLAVVYRGIGRPGVEAVE